MDPREGVTRVETDGEKEAQQWQQKLERSHCWREAVSRERSGLSTVEDRQAPGESARNAALCHLTALWSPA